MKIQANKQGIQAIQDLCDIALKYGGMKLLQGVNEVLSSVEEIQEKEEVEDPADKENS